MASSPPDISQATSRKWLVFATVALATFMSTLDSSIVNIAMPTLAQAFGVSPSTILWVTLVFILTITGLMLPLGRIADMLGRRRVFNLGLIIFTLGLGLCSLAQSLEQLLGARVVQAIGGAMVTANANAIVTAVFPSDERGRALGLLEAIVGIGLMSGPALGGVLLEMWDWRSIFWLRLPVGVGATAMAFALLPRDRGEGERGHFDLVGAITLFGGLVFTLLAANQGPAQGWGSPFVMGFGLGGLALLVTFFLVEARTSHPVLDFSLFQNRAFSLLNLTLLANFIASMGASFLMPFLLIEGIGLGKSTSGLILTTVPVMMLVLSPVSGLLADRLGSRQLSLGGQGLVASGLFLLSRLNGSALPLDVVGRLIVQGTGAGLFLTPAYSGVMGSVPRARLGTASALIATVRSVGQSAGLTLAGTLLAARRAYHVQALGLALAGEELARQGLVGGIQDALLAEAAICALAAAINLVLGRVGKSPKGG